MAGRFVIENIFKAIDRVTAPVTRMQARVGKFTRATERGLRRANRVLGKFNRGLARGGRGLLRWGRNVTAAIGIASVVAINRVAGAADNLAKRSRRLEFPIDALQEWQFVAEQSGLTTEGFDKAIEKFTKSVGEAKAGTGTLVTILRKANPELLRQLNNTTNAAEAFDLYLQAMRDTEDQTVKTALATAAFGRTGAKFINITEQSADAIKALRLEQRENGIITAEQAREAEKYNDAVNSLKRSLFGLLQTVIIPMLPRLTETVRTWREWIVANKELIRLKIVGFLRDLKARFDKLVTALRELNARYNLAELFLATLSAGLKFGAFLERHGATLLKIIASVVALSAVLKILTGVMAVVNLVMAANPIGLIIIAIGVLIGLIAAAIVWWEDIKAAFLEFVESGNLLKPLMLGPIGLLISAAAGIMRHWEPVKTFFADLWQGIVDAFNWAIENIMTIMRLLPGPLQAAILAGETLGSLLASDDAGAAPGGQQVVAPGERVARSISERRDTAELLIRDETGRGELSSSGTGAAAISLEQSGAFT